MNNVVQRLQSHFEELIRGLGSDFKFSSLWTALIIKRNERAPKLLNKQNFNLILDSLQDLDSSEE